MRGVRIHRRLDLRNVSWAVDLGDACEVMWMFEEVFAGVAFIAFACCVVYTFWMAAEEDKYE